MAAVLAEHIERHVVSRWGWGTVDCVFFAINWVRDATGIDPAERLRGSYSDEESARTVIEREGGFETMVRHEMAAHGFREINDPADGDVGMVLAPTRTADEYEPVMAIRSGGRWVVKTMRGIRAGQYDQLYAWKII